jgi:hypothetical protein
MDVPLRKETRNLKPSESSARIEKCVKGELCRDFITWSWFESHPHLFAAVIVFACHISTFCSVVAFVFSPIRVPVRKSYFPSNPKS